MTENEHAPSAESIMAANDLAIREPPRILVPVKVLEGETISESLVEFLAPAEIVLLGYHVIPEQTPTEQASMQFEDRAQAAIEDIARTFREAGRNVETRVVFTHDREQTVERVAREVEATATLLPNPSGRIEDVVVPLRGAIDVGRLADLVATLLAEREGTVTLWGLANDDGRFDVGTAVTTARETLLGRGFPGDRITTETDVSNAPVRDIVKRSDEFDITVMGEGGPSLLTSLLGDPSERIAKGAVSPVLVVRAREDTSSDTSPPE